MNLHTCAQVETIQGTEGNFTVTILQHPRYVDVEKCIACGLCAEKCPKKVTDEATSQFKDALTNMLHEIMEEREL